MRIQPYQIRNVLEVYKNHLGQEPVNERRKESRISAEGENKRFVMEKVAASVIEKISQMTTEKGDIISSFFKKKPEVSSNQNHNYTFIFDTITGDHQKEMRSINVGDSHWEKSDILESFPAI